MVFELDAIGAAGLQGSKLLGFAAVGPIQFN
jgi:hypothetical protein